MKQKVKKNAHAHTFHYISILSVTQNNRQAQQHPGNMGQNGQAEEGSHWQVVRRIHVMSVWQLKMNVALGLNSSIHTHTHIYVHTHTCAQTHTLCHDDEERGIVTDVLVH